MQRWLADYQDSAVEYAQQGYDQIQDYVKSNFNEYVEANNLTQVQLMLCPGGKQQAFPVA